MDIFFWIVLIVTIYAGLLIPGLLHQFWTEFKREFLDNDKD